MLSKLLRRLRPRSVYDVMAAIACFGVLAGGTAYAANTVRSTDIVDGEVKSADVKDQSLTTFDVSTFLGADIVDGSLDDRDIGKAASINVTGDFGTIPAHSCRGITIGTAIGSNGDHLILTPNYDTTAFFVEFTVQSQTGGGAQVLGCNPTDSAIVEGTASFNLLDIAAR
jgi:hypothetical protein